MACSFAKPAESTYVQVMGEGNGHNYTLTLGRWRIALSDLGRLDELLQRPRPRLVDVRMARLVVAGCVEFAYYDTPLTRDRFSPGPNVGPFT